MAFPQPRPQAPQLPQHLLRTIDCQQGAVRAVRFNSKKKPPQKISSNWGCSAAGWTDWTDSIAKSGCNVYMHNKILQVQFNSIEYVLYFISSKYVSSISQFWVIHLYQFVSVPCLLSWWELPAVLWQWQVFKTVEYEPRHLVEDVQWSWIWGFGCRWVRELPWGCPQGFSLRNIGSEVI